MSSAAQRNELTRNASGYPPVEAATVEVPGEASDEASARGALKHLAAERLAAHRNRRAVAESLAAQARREQAEAQAVVRLQARRDANRAEAHPDALRVREAVAARYRQSLSYHEFMAAEAQRAAAEARAKAEVAARNAQAVAAVQRQLLEEAQRQLLEETQRQLREEAQRQILQEARPQFLDETAQGKQTGPGIGSKPGELPGKLPGEMLEDLPPLEIVNRCPGPDPDPHTQASAASFAPAARFTPAQLQVRLPEEVEIAPPAETFCLFAPAARDVAPSGAPSGAPDRAEELAQLDQEIEFRLSPEFSELRLETQPIPANIIEFPRELVAPRKARPRLAEGPLRDEDPPEPQLRIFEVEPTQISAEPEATALAAAPEWQGLMLGAGPAEERRTRISAQLEEQLHLDQPFYVATVKRRAYAAAMDLVCITAGLTGFLAMVLKFGGNGLLALPRPLLGGAAAGSFVIFAAIYQTLFFTLNEATPGMRGARVALCTFNERSPSRRAMRRRLVSTALAACPLGLGLVWMLLDGEGLGWHDRISRMYPRAY